MLESKHMFYFFFYKIKLLKKFGEYKIFLISKVAFYYSEIELLIFFNVQGDLSIEP